MDVSVLPGLSPWLSTMDGTTRTAGTLSLEMTRLPQTYDPNQYCDNLEALTFWRGQWEATVGETAFVAVALGVTDTGDVTCVVKMHGTISYGTEEDPTDCNTATIAVAVDLYDAGDDFNQSTTSEPVPLLTAVRLEGP